MQNHQQLQMIKFPRLLQAKPKDAESAAIAATNLKSGWKFECKQVKHAEIQGFAQSLDDEPAF
jgi:hypothetical protein